VLSTPPHQQEVLSNVQRWHQPPVTMQGIMLMLVFKDAQLMHQVMKYKKQRRRKESYTDTQHMHVSKCTHAK
jgi:hypothetical protein